MDGYDRLELAMERAGFSRKEIALEVGFNVGNFASWKSRRDLPKAEVLVPMCRILKVSIDYLVTGEEPIFDPWARAHQGFINDMKELTEEQRSMLMKMARVQADENRAAKAPKDVGKPTSSA